jgi:hypothetical protein
MRADDERDPLDSWLNQQVKPLPPPPGTFELITRRARRRKLRKLAVTVVSAAAVAAAVAFAVPAGLALHLTQPSATEQPVAQGSATHPGTRSPDGSATPLKTPSPSRPVTQGPSTPGYLPPNFAPFSVTWDSLNRGWVIGPAGTAGHCGAQQNSAICTSVARTTDGGQTWSGLPAPIAAGPEQATGVSGIRFADDEHGWAFGPDLWSTADGGESWSPVPTGNAAVTDLETVNGRAWALFGSCSNDAAGGDTIANCRSYTLMTTTVGSDTWTPVAGVPANLSSGTGLASAVIELSNTEAYLIAPDGTLYSGSVNGGSWHRLQQLQCPPSTALPDGLPRGAMLAPAGTMASGATRLALVCSAPDGTHGYATVAYLSDDGGADWTKLSGVGNSGTAAIGQPQSLAATSDGTLMLATTSGIYRLPLGAAQWQQASLTGSQAPANGFSYVGMTSSTQGVALASPAQTQIWMTFDGGLTWQARPIKAG